MKIWISNKNYSKWHFARERARTMITSSPIVRSLSFSELWFKTKIPPDRFFIFWKNRKKKICGVRCKKIVKKMAKNFDIFWRTAKFLFFIFLIKTKKTSGGILVLNQCFERLRDRTHGDEVIITRERVRAPNFWSFFSKWPPKNFFFHKKKFFS